MSLSALLEMPGMAFLLDLLIKSILLLIAAGLVAALLRRSAAANRHLVWACALGALLLLPLLSLIVPGIPVQGWGYPARSSEVRKGAAVVADSDVATTNGTPGATVAANAATPQPFPWSALLLGIYGLGMVCAVAQVPLGLVGVKTLAKQSVALEDEEPLHALSEEAASLMGVPVPVTLRLGEDAPVPMTWGWRRPTVLLPTDAVDWEPERVRVALLHEMAHIARADWIVQLFAHVVCGVYWFHPLVWWAVSHLRAEAERAADDRVLLAGVPATEYAKHLLEIAQLLRPDFRSVPTGASAMAATPKVEDRITYLLNRSVRRLSPRHSRALLGLFVGLTLALAGVHADGMPPEPRSDSAIHPAPGAFSIRLENDIQLKVAAIAVPNRNGWLLPTGKPASGLGDPLDQEEFRAGFTGDTSMVAVRADYPASSDVSLDIIGTGMVYGPDIVHGRKQVSLIYNDEAPQKSRTTIQVRVASGAWHEQGVWKEGEAFTPASQMSMSSASFPARPIVFSAPLPKADEPKVVTFNIGDRWGGEAFRVLVQDRTGRSYRANQAETSTVNKMRVARLSVKGVRPQDIVRISFQTRPYRLVEFPNVPLTPSAMQAIKVEGKE